MPKQGEKRSETSYVTFADDPYSYAMIRIVPSLRRSLRYKGRMSEDELKILEDIKKVIEDNDPESLKLEAQVKVDRMPSQDSKEPGF